MCALTLALKFTPEEPPSGVGEPGGQSGGPADGRVCLSCLFLVFFPFLPSVSPFSLIKLS